MLSSNELLILENSRQEFIECAFNRYASGGSDVHLFRLPLTAFGRSRVREEFINDIKQAFSDFGIEARYNSAIREFIIRLNLHHCIFSADEAATFNRVQTHRRNEGYE